MLPGVQSRQAYIDADVAGNLDETGTIGTLNIAASRVLIRQNLIQDTFFLSPAEIDPSKRIYSEQAGADVEDPGNIRSPANDPFVRNHTSFAMMMGGHGTADNANFLFNETRRGLSAGKANPLPGVNFASAADGLAPIFAAAWGDALDSQTPMVGDCVVWGTDAVTAGLGQSIWTHTGEYWRGGLAWGDNHVSFEARPTTARSNDLSKVTPAKASSRPTTTTR